MARRHHAWFSRDARAMIDVCGLLHFDIVAAIFARAGAPHQPGQLAAAPPCAVADAAGRVLVRPDAAPHDTPFMYSCRRCYDAASAARRRGRKISRLQREAIYSLEFLPPEARSAQCTLSTCHRFPDIEACLAVVFIQSSLSSPARRRWRTLRASLYTPAKRSLIEATQDVSRLVEHGAHGSRRHAACRRR